MSEGRRTVGIVFVSLIVDLLGFTVILPLLPTLLEYYGHKQDYLYETLQNSVHGFREVVGAPNTARWNSVLFGGFIGSMFSFLQFCSSPIMGAMSDVYGRKPLLLLSMVGVAISYVLWALSHNFTIFVIARIIGGISKGNVSLSTTIVTDVTDSKNRGKGMAMIGIAFSIGFILGPLLGALFAKQAREMHGEFYTTPALFALTLAVIDIIFIFLFLKETLPKSKRVQTSTSVSSVLDYINPVSLFGFNSLKASLRSEDLQSLRRLGFVYFLYLFIFSGLEFTLTFLTHMRFQYDSMQQGKMFFFLGIVMATVQGGYVRRLQPGSEKKCAMRGMVALIPAFIMIGLATNQLMLYGGLVIFAYAAGSVVPCMTSLVSAYGNESEKGAVMGIFRSLGALARAFGPLFACFVYWSIGDAVCYMIGASLLVFPIILMSRYRPMKDVL